MIYGDLRGVPETELLKEVTRLLSKPGALSPEDVDGLLEINREMVRRDEETS